VPVDLLLEDFRVGVNEPLPARSRSRHLFRATVMSQALAPRTSPLNCQYRRKVSCVMSSASWASRRMP
jgi:hypothetical protein